MPKVQQLPPAVRPQNHKQAFELDVPNQRLVITVLDPLSKEDLVNRINRHLAAWDIDIFHRHYRQGASERVIWSFPNHRLFRVKGAEICLALGIEIDQKILDLMEKK